AASVYAQGFGALTVLAAIVLSVLLKDRQVDKLVMFAGLALGGLGLLACVAGFGLGIPGPKKARHIAIAGIVVTLIQGGLVAVELKNAVNTEPKEVVIWADTLDTQQRLGVVTNLPLLAEHPARILKHYSFSVPAVLGAAMEFARLVMLCMLIQYYATDGKDPKLGHDAMACVNRIFWLVLLAAMFRVSAAFGFDWMPPGDTTATIGVGMHVIITIGGLMFLAVNLLWTGQVIRDVTEIVEAKRFAADTARLDR
ncbi:MAG: hypothetical protein ACRC7O_09865, partial [Fimbriiglobus sp.]